VCRAYGRTEKGLSHRCHFGEHWASGSGRMRGLRPTGPTSGWSLGARFLISKSAEPGNEVTGRFGGPGTLSAIGLG